MENSSVSDVLSKLWNAPKRNYPTYAAAVLVLAGPILRLISSLNKAREGSESMRREMNDGF